MNLVGLEQSLYCAMPDCNVQTGDCVLNIGSAGVRWKGVLGCFLIFWPICFSIDSRIECV